MRQAILLVKRLPNPTHVNSDNNTQQAAGAGAGRAAIPTAS